MECMDAQIKILWNDGDSKLKGKDIHVWATLKHVCTEIC